MRLVRVARTGIGIDPPEVGRLEALVDIRPTRIGSGADDQVDEAVRQGEDRSWPNVGPENDGEPPLRRRVIGTAGIGEALARLTVGQKVGRRPEELGCVHGRCQGATVGVIDPHPEVDDLHDETIAGAQALIWRRHRRIHAGVDARARIALIHIVDPVKTVPAVLPHLPGGRSSG